MKPTCIDLFSGCGGLSLGMLRAGIDVVAAIDFDKQAIDTLSANLRQVRYPLCEDLTTFEPGQLSDIIGTQNVDVIVGGPPCQGFSTARQRDGANSGPRLVEDRRRHLYRELLRFVEFFRPKIFVIENVLGIKSAAQGEYFMRVQREARAIGYRVHPQIEKASDLGVPQKRVRQLIIGTRLDLALYFPGKLAPVSNAFPTTLGEAIGDLPALTAGSGLDPANYDLRRRGRHVAKYGCRFLFDVLEVDRAKQLTAHVARPHNLRDLRDFARLREGEHSGRAIARGVRLEFPYDRNSFRDRYTRQHRQDVCSTIVAHMSKDGLMFIHPTQNRSLTVREAARVQTFPDWFRWAVPRTHQYRLIGNAVPPLVAHSLGLAIKEFLVGSSDLDKLESSSGLIPNDVRDAAKRLFKLLASADAESLRRMSRDDFRSAWCAIAFVYPELHPDSARDHGSVICPDRSFGLMVADNFAAGALRKRYAQSGWPVALAGVAAEALRRHDTGELPGEDLYCTSAAAAGLRLLRRRQRHD